jgi:hypothetical protein
MKVQGEIVVRAEQLPLRVTVIGIDGLERAYQLIPARKFKGAQLCAADK